LFHDANQLLAAGQRFVAAAEQLTDRLVEAAPVRGDDPAAHVVTVRAGQIPVEDHHVIPGQRQALDRAVAVEDHVDRHPLAAQPGSDRAGQNSRSPQPPGRASHQRCQAGGGNQVSSGGTGLTPPPA
jgi:hypothetical protein